jgi:hypothetical protein
MAIRQWRPILSNEGWNSGLELKPLVPSTFAFETHYFYERLFPRIERLVKPKDAGAAARGQRF